MPKRTYKLTKEEKAKAKILYAKGYTKHGALSKKLGVSRQKVSNWLKEWEDVKSYQRMFGKSWKTSIEQVKHTPYWGGKRLKKLDPNSMEYWRQKYEIERRLTGQQKKIWEEEEYVYGSTPS
jgi:Txe/YoeB family toxin of Txe-Axe toxin-antitoxin module